METVRASGRYDWLVELTGAALFAAACAFAATQLAPGWVMPAGFTAFVAGFAAMKRIAPEPATLSLPFFEPVGLPADDLPELLLDTLADKASEELLLVDAVPGTDPESRVVRLFAPERMPTAGQLKARIDAHLAAAPTAAVNAIPDASDALFAALADLRRSLR